MAIGNILPSLPTGRFNTIAFSPNLLTASSLSSPCTTQAPGREMRCNPSSPPEERQTTEESVWICTHDARTITSAHLFHHLFPKRDQKDVDDWVAFFASSWLYLLQSSKRWESACFQVLFNARVETIHAWLGEGDQSLLIPSRCLL